jgi:hypothetical protein
MISASGNPPRAIFGSLSQARREEFYIPAANWHGFAAVHQFEAKRSGTGRGCGITHLTSRA